MCVRRPQLNDSCINMGSDESHFNVSVGSDGQSHRTVVHKDSIHKPQPFRRGRRAEADGNRGRSAYRWAKLAHKPERPFIACGEMTGIARSWQSAWPPGERLPFGRRPRHPSPPLPARARAEGGLSLCLL